MPDCPYMTSVHPEVRYSNFDAEFVTTDEDTETPVLGPGLVRKELLCTRAASRLLRAATPSQRERLAFVLAAHNRVVTADDVGQMENLAVRYLASGITPTHHAPIFAKSLVQDEEDGRVYFDCTVAPFADLPGRGPGTRNYTARWDALRGALLGNTDAVAISMVVLLPDFRVARWVPPYVHYGTADEVGISPVRALINRELEDLARYQTACATGACVPTPLQYVSRVDALRLASFAVKEFDGSKLTCGLMIGCPVVHNEGQLFIYALLNLVRAVSNTVSAFYDYCPGEFHLRHATTPAKAGFVRECAMLGSTLGVTGRAFEPRECLKIACRVVVSKFLETPVVCRAATASRLFWALNVFLAGAHTQTLTEDVALSLVGVVTAKPCRIPEQSTLVQAIREESRE
jgi:hypothetical protein